jgi:hypothetical protein
MRQRRLIIRSSYAPNRLGKAYLLDAYEKLAPITKHPIKPDKQRLPVLEESKLISLPRSNIK